ncbi:Nse4 C-terminal-domain-containing protein [Microdochium bolleyi]|uniref:Non-structural maintenance of chromosomes element 4 n=1 Tax=Microdochium bolleyi TaxID=196109 RepID=A0A136J9Q3_9PEZI|nr:Nse4 C-terminal-domain-containing protein [Microdochium bolleyi]
MAGSDSDSDSADSWASRPQRRQSTLVVRDKGKQQEVASKRKRTLTTGAGNGGSRRRTHEPEPEESEGENHDLLQGGYDPDQPLEQRREVQRGLRDLLRGLNENGDSLLQPNSTGLLDIVKRANELTNGIKQTTEATIDSRLLVSTVDASYRKTVRLTSGNVAQGLDIDEFLSKCASYMRLGAGIEQDDAPGLTSTQQQRRRPGTRRLNRDDDDDDDGEDEVGDEGDALNWEHLGRYACVPHIRRPAVPGFLLGPLSVEKKVRKVVKRSAPFKASNLTETRPEVLNVEDVQRSEKNDLTAICSKILQRLRQHQTEAQETIEEAYEKDGISDDEAQMMMQKWGLRDTGGIDLLRFVVNPRSFGQTVENLFYVSFLIRDGQVRIDFDSNEFPTLLPVDKDEEQSTGTKHGAQRQQAVLSIDMGMWRDIIETFDIKESIIPHRKEETHKGPGARGWYS